MKDREIMHVREQQEEAFPHGEVLWEMTMAAGWWEVLTGAQSHRRWARQAELVRLWLLSPNSPAHKASPKWWDMIWGQGRIRVRIRAGGSSRVQSRVQWLPGRVRVRISQGQQPSSIRSAAIVRQESHDRAGPKAWQGNSSAGPGQGGHSQAEANPQQSLGRPWGLTGPTLGRREPSLTTGSGTALLSSVTSCMIPEAAWSTGSSAPGR